MKKLNYKEIDKDNVIDIMMLSKSLTEEQQKCVASNAVSIAQGSVHSYAYYRGVYHNDKPVGFFMLSIPNDETKKSNVDNDFYLWRLMIKLEEQHNHYGTEILDHIAEIGRELGHKELYTSCEMGEVSPYEFYLKYGFTDTNTVEDGEQVLLFKL